MSGASLDDFFAKKDKSKKKSKSKLTPTDILEKLEPEDNKPKKEKKKKDKEKTQTSSNTTQGAAKKVEEEDEWLDFQEETEKDYSGLRIQNLQVASKEDEEEQEESDEGEEDENSEKDKKQNVASGVWAVSSSAQPQASKPALRVGETSQPAPAPSKPREEVGKVVGKYVPPGMRSSLGGSSPAVSTQQIIRRKKEAPNIKSELDFPTLGGPGRDAAQDNVQDQANYEHPGRGRSVQLSLENKFAALQD